MRVRGKAHGMPFPQNLSTADDVEAVVRQHGATPATIAIIRGNVHVGLEQAELQLLAEEGAESFTKVSRRDLAAVRLFCLFPSPPKKPSPHLLSPSLSLPSYAFAFVTPPVVLFISLCFVPVLITAVCTSDAVLHQSVLLGKGMVQPQSLERHSSQVRTTTPPVFSQPQGTRKRTTALP